MKAGPDEVQRNFDKSVENDIVESIKNGMRDEDPPEEPDETTGKSAENGEDVKKSKKSVEKEDKKTDNEDEETTDDEKSGYEKVVEKVLREQFNGDESRIDEAKAVANMAVKTFNGDPIRAAKSYRNLWKQKNKLDNTIKQNPFIEKLIKDASEKGITIDENYVKEQLGAVTSEQPTEKKKSPAPKHDQLEDDEDFDLDSLTADELIDSGVLNEKEYKNAASSDRKDMVEKAKLKYGWKVLPDKIAERSVKLKKQKEQELSKQEKINKAKKTNKQRLMDNYQEVVTKYDVDFDNNPEHAQLWDDIQQAAYRIPDIDDDDGLLIKETAFEEAMQHIFNKNGISLQSTSIPGGEDETVEDTTKKKHKQSMRSGDEEAIARILSDANSFKGKSTSKSSESDDEPDPNDVSEQVNARVNRTIQQGMRTTQMISSNRKMDNKK